jgi:hypothetical protein
MTIKGAIALGLLVAMSGAAAKESVPAMGADSAFVAGVTLGQGRSSPPSGTGPVAQFDLDEYLELHAHARTGLHYAASRPGSAAVAGLARNAPAAP